MLDLEDVPAGLRDDRSDDGARRGIEYGLVEIGEQLAACHLTEVAAFVLAAGFGEGLGELAEVAAAAGLLGDVAGVFLSGLRGQRPVRAEDDDLAQLGALSQAVVLLLAVVALAELLVGEVFTGSQLVAEDLVRDDLVAHARFHVGARHAGLGEQVFELLVGGDAVLLFHAIDGVFHLVGGDGDAEAVGAVFDEQLGDELVHQGLARLFLLGRELIGRGGLLGLGERVVETLRVLGAGDDAVPDANDDCFDDVRRAEGGRRERQHECDECFFHSFSLWRTGRA